MPNYCNNQLRICGTKKSLEEFRNNYFTIDENGEVMDFDFEKVIPSPKEQTECPSEYIIHNKEEADERHLGYDESDPTKWFDWYNWRIYHWGTKWGPCYVSSSGFDLLEDAEDDDEIEVFIYFDTAWAPPEPVILKLALMHQELEIEDIYFEPGMMLMGKINKFGIESCDGAEGEEAYKFIMDNDLMPDEQARYYCFGETETEESEEDEED